MATRKPAAAVVAAAVLRSARTALALVRPAPTPELSHLCRLDEKIRKLDEQLAKHKDAIKKCRPGPAQEAAKRRALAVSPAAGWRQAALGCPAGMLCSLIILEFIAAAAHPHMPVLPRSGGPLPLGCTSAGAKAEAAVRVAARAAVQPAV